MRTSCQSCGADIDIARVSGSDESVALEVYGDPSTDAPRYRIVKLLPLTVEPVAEGAVGDFRPDHRVECPGHGAGRR